MVVLVRLTITLLRSRQAPCQAKPQPTTFLLRKGRYTNRMTKKQSRCDIPIAKVVIAFQPRSSGESRHGIEPGRVALFRVGDPRVHLFDCHDGACWVPWRASPDRQLEWMIDIKRRLVRECGVARAHADGAFQRCREYWEHRKERRRYKDVGRSRKLRAEARTR